MHDFNNAEDEQEQSLSHNPDPLIHTASKLVNQAYSAKKTNKHPAFTFLIFTNTRNDRIHPVTWTIYKYESKH